MCCHRPISFGAALLLVPLVASGTGCLLHLGTPRYREDRELRVEHRAHSPLRVQTGDGSVTVTRSELDEVEITARLWAPHPDRFLDATVYADRAEDGTLAVGVRWSRRPRNAGCSFEIRIPDVDGVTVDTGDGSVRLEGLAGEAHVETGDGSVRIARHDGSVRIRTGDGSVRIADVDGDVDARTSDGTVHAEDCRGSVEMETGDGSVRAHGIRGDLVAETGDGTIRVTDVDGALRARTSDGSVRVEDCQGSVEVDTGDGTVDVRLAAACRGPVWIDTGDGTVTLALGPSFQGRLTARTHDGSIDLGSLDGRAVEIRQLSRREVELQFPGDGASSRVVTHDGSIRLRRR